MGVGNPELVGIGQSLTVRDMGCSLDLLVSDVQLCLKSVKKCILGNFTKFDWVESMLVTKYPKVPPDLVRLRHQVFKE